MNNQEKIISSETTTNPESKHLSPMQEIQQLRETAKNLVTEQKELQAAAREGKANAREVLDKVEAIQAELDLLMLEEIEISNKQKKKYELGERDEENLDRAFEAAEGANVLRKIDDYKDRKSA